MSDKTTEKLFRKAVSAVKAKKGRGLVFGSEDPTLSSPEPRRSSFPGYKGKIKPYDLREMNQRLEEFTERNNTTLKQLETKYLASGFSPTRFRWDLFHAAMSKGCDTNEGNEGLVMRLYAYANDENIDTAMRYLIQNSR